MINILSEKNRETSFKKGGGVGSLGQVLVKDKSERECDVVFSALEQVVEFFLVLAYISSRAKDNLLDTNQQDKVMLLPSLVEGLIIKEVCIENLEKSIQTGFEGIAVVGIVKRGLDTYQSQYEI